MKQIDTIKELNALIGSAYVYAIIIAIAALAIALAVAKLIKWNGGKTDKSYSKRRAWYLVIGILAPVTFFLYNVLIVSQTIAKAPLQAKFLEANILATAILVGIYVIAGITGMFIFRRSKWGSILGKK
jgi:hypothetical protein